MNLKLHPKRTLTAGEIAQKANEDQTVYNSMEVGHAMTEDIAKQLAECARIHDEIFMEDEYFVIMQLAGDPLIHNLLRRKFYAWLYLPDPAPRQSVFLWSKAKQQFLKRMWVLPDVIGMETLCEITNVAPQYKTMQTWSKAFYAGKFWETIRAETGTKYLSKSEYLNVHRAEIIKQAGNKVEVLRPDTFDFSKVSVKQVVDPNESILH